MKMPGQAAAFEQDSDFAKEPMDGAEGGVYIIYTIRAGKAGSG